MKKRLEVLFLATPLLIGLLFFNAYFFRGKLLFPGNLLVSFYSPWKYEVFKGWEHGVPHKPLGFDNLRFFYPIRKEILAQLKEKKPPLWNPYSFSGNVLLADSQSAVLYPPNFIFLILPFMHAWSLLVISVPLMAGIFTYLFLRTYKLSTISSFFGGLSFALSGFMIVWIEENPAVSHSAAWLPVALYGIRKFIDTRAVRFWLIALLALIFSILAGFLQITIYLWLASIAYAVYELIYLGNKDRRRLLVPVAAIFIFSFLISAIQLFPSFEAYLSSPRVTASAEYLSREYLLPLMFLITLIVPDIFGNPGTHNFFGGGFYYDKILYVGLLPFIFALYAILRKRKETFFFGIIGVLALVLGINNPISKLLFHFKIPFFSTVTPSRIFYLTAFSMAVLAAFGLEDWLKKQDKINLKKVIVIILATLFLAGLFSLSRLVPLMENTQIKMATDQLTQLFYPGIPFGSRLALISLRNLLVSLGVFSVTAGILIFWIKKPKWKRLLLVGLMIIFIFHQYYFLKKSLYTTEGDFIFPETSAIKYLKENSRFQRIIGVGQARVFPNLLVSFRLFSPEGLDPVFSRRYGELINAINTGAFSTDIPRIEARLIFDEEKDFENKTKLKALSFLGVKFLLVPQKNENKPPRDFTLPTDQFQKVWEKNDLTIWENKYVFPRCWFVNDYIINNHPQEIIETMFSESFDLKNKLVLEEDLSIKLNNYYGKNDGRMEIMEYNADSVKIKTETDVDGILFCAENFYSGWKAKIDGKETKIYRANYTFRAVILPKGRHEIVFSYEPLIFKYGATISIIGLLLAGIYGLIFL